MARFIVIVLDGFGIGEMPDVLRQRPQDIGANTAVKLLNHFPLKRLPTLERLGLLNALPATRSIMQPNHDACWGKALLAHFGCDTFMGHQEIMGTQPKPPTITPFSQSITGIEIALKAQDYQVVRFSQDGLSLLVVNSSVVIGDNLEADLGQVYNLTANFNQISFDEVKRIAQVVRQANTVSRNIAFGGHVPSMDAIFNAIETQQNDQGIPTYIGVNAPNSGTYENGFQVVHLGYGVDANTQVPHCLHQIGIPTNLYGKVADIVQNDTGISYREVVDTNQVFTLLLNDLNHQTTGFFCANVQETDLSGHQQDPKRYWQILEKADAGINRVINTMAIDDLLVVMADHGNDPFIGHTKHTREMVPVLVYRANQSNKHYGELTTLADIGASAAEFFGANWPESGQASIT
ncbi:phosphopentomutase [Photobacterium nomapromontoriensis]|uniref:phosphopentomutase n=1 Tax=Photobacterium nomapromontoriensis TaxID=2910237 RepID=UPI003D0B5274